MTTIAIILIVIVIVSIFLLNNYKKSTNPHSSPGQDYSKNQKANLNRYLPQNIQRSGLQVLETIHIIATSNALDTIKGRYQLLLQIIEILKSGQNNPRYLTDIQKSIDSYKSMYYDRIPDDYELALLLKPNDFNLSDFYCQCLFRACKNSIEEHLEEVKILKRDDAKVRRKEKIKETIRFSKEELISKCANTTFLLQ